MRSSVSRMARDTSPRRRAVEVLESFFSGDRRPLSLAPAAAALPEIDRDLFRELVLGVLRQRTRLDFEIAAASTIPLPKLRRFVREVVEVALYQMRRLDRVPARAAVHEAVEDARALAGEGAARLVNGVLRRLQREPVTIPRGSGAAGLAVEHSHPEFLVARWIERFGQDKAREILAADNERSPMDLLADFRRIASDELLRSLAEDGVTASAIPLAPGALQVASGNPLRSRAFAEGLLYIADAGAQALPRLLPPGETLLDLAAAPGGKTAAALFSGRFRKVISVDRSLRRLGTFLQNRRRMDLAAARPLAADLARLPFPEEAFDRVLLDAPCSGTGTLRKNPEIRYRVTAADVAALAQTQLELLRRAAEVVVPGGYLLYATCSLEKEENEDVAAALLETPSDFVPATIEPPPGLERFVSGNVFRIFPDDGADGFTAHLLKRGS